MNGLIARLRGWIWLVAWVATGLRRPPRASQPLELADMGTAFGLDCSLDEHAPRDTRAQGLLARERTTCRPTSAFIPATVRARRARS
jgi:hypothetical protein